MSIVILIPALVCIVAIVLDSPQRAFLNVYLPVFLCLPSYYFWKVSALPPIHFQEAALIPIGLALIFYDMPRWHFTRCDLWVALFVFSSFWADHVKEQFSLSTFELFATLNAAGVTYIAGKLLIEQYNAREATIKRIVFILFAVGIFSSYEYRMGKNPFRLLLSPLFTGEEFGWFTQIRWGFGRVAGPYAQSELAGTIFFCGLILALYLNYCRIWEPKFKRFEWLPFKKSTIVTWTVAFTLLMCQARGPWVGFVVALPIALIGRTRRVLKSALVVGVVGVVLGAVGYVALVNYTAGPRTSQDQENAQYRTHLISNYTPVVRQGGLFGWGKDFPKVGTQDSIDNAYLYIALTQGYLGLFSLAMIAFESLLSATKLAFFGGSPRHRYFGFSLLGILMGLLVVIGTVFLGEQPYQLFFLLAGWSQSLQYSLGKVKQAEPAFEAVYT